MSPNLIDWRLYIDGNWHAGEGGPDREVVNPATGAAFTHVPEASRGQALAAIAAARRAQPAWGRRAPIERARIMKRIASLIRRDAEALAKLVVMEQGKPILEARGEVGGAAEFFEFYAEYARRIQGEILPSDFAEEQIWIQRVPIGVVVGIIPWNYPAALVSRKVAPAMIAGDAIVLKPHELTPLSALYMARLFEEAEVPAGVVNIVTGAGPVVGEALCGSPDVDLVTMTGSVPAGRRIMTVAAQNLTAVSLELGGKAPFIVMADADLDLAVRSAVTSRFMNCGQVCICNERTLVEAPIFDAFVERFVAETRKLRIGDPMSEDTDIGPKMSEKEREKVEAMVTSAVSEGAGLALAGGRPADPPTPGGYWMSPTVLTNVRPDMDIMQKEIFGPVVPVMPFETFSDAVGIANRSRYGLSAYLFTRDIRRVMEMVRDVDFGEIYVNRIGPESLQGFHVGYRQSGVGGDDGTHGLELYLKKKTVYVNYSSGPTAGLMPYSAQ
jgi:lactaldehyde dehydrogenase/glycolaldehyde dehydrogenase